MRPGLVLLLFNVACACGLRVFLPSLFLFYDASFNCLDAQDFGFEAVKVVKRA